MPNFRPIAIHLPQYHPFLENDEWWGKGFTEWTNVTKSQPKFEGHYQPHLPADMGFYDLRLEETRIAQAELAKAHGIYGFCYYHYWFNGKRLMEKPVDEILKSGKPDFPFCLCWANENWTRRWDGQDQEVLIAQNYSDDDDVAHIIHLQKYFSDSRYIRVNGKPVFVVYKSHLLPNPKQTTDTWRKAALGLGIGELYLIRMEFDMENPTNPLELGFDSSVEFQPFCRPLTLLNEESVMQKIYRKLFTTKKSLYWENRIFDYNELLRINTEAKKPLHKIFPAASPAWDNSARRKIGATMLKYSTPQKYGKWLKHIMNTFTPYSSQENFIFINAWNEWAEGNHLEPCQKWGSAYLEATKEAFKN